MYFVAEWMTASIPSSSGRWFAGEAQVLSAIVMIPFSWPMRATAARSVIASVGLAGVST